MAYQKELVNQALQILANRRQTAVITAQERLDALSGELESIAQIQKELSQTSLALARLVLARPEDLHSMIEHLRDNNLKLQQRRDALLVQHGLPQDYLEVQYHCPLCKDTGFVNNQKCACLKQLLGNLAAKKLNEQSPMSLSSFDNFDLSYYPADEDGQAPSPRSVMQKVVGYCQRYAQTFSPQSTSILMVGGTGLGKTHLSLAIANTVLQQGYSAIYMSCQDMLRQIEREHFGREADEQTLELALNTDLLILDDLGAEFDSSFYASVVYNLINTRINKGLPTIVSTNLTAQELENKYSARVTSRLYTLYTVLRFVGNDVRLIKKEQRRQGS